MHHSDLLGVWRYSGTQRPDYTEWQFNADGTYAIRSYPRADYAGQFTVVKRDGRTLSLEVTGLGPSVWKGDAALGDETLELGGRTLTKAPPSKAPAPEIRSALIGVWRTDGPSTFRRWTFQPDGTYVMDGYPSLHVEGAFAIVSERGAEVCWTTDGVEQRGEIIGDGSLLRWGGSDVKRVGLPSHVVGAWALLDRSQTWRFESNGAYEALGTTSERGRVIVLDDAGTRWRLRLSERRCDQVTLPDLDAWARLDGATLDWLDLTLQRQYDAPGQQPVP